MEGTGALYRAEIGRENAFAEEREERVGLVGEGLETGGEKSRVFLLDSLRSSKKEKRARGEEQLEGAAIELLQVYTSEGSNGATATAADFLRLLGELQLSSSLNQLRSVILSPSRSKARSPTPFLRSAARVGVSE